MQTGCYSERRPTPQTLSIIFRHPKFKRSGRRTRKKKEGVTGIKGLHIHSNLQLITTVSEALNLPP